MIPLRLQVLVKAICKLDKVSIHYIMIKKELLSNNNAKILDITMADNKNSHYIYTEVTNARK